MPLRAAAGASGSKVATSPQKAFFRAKKEPTSGSKTATSPKAFLKTKKEPADGSRAATSLKAFLRAKKEPADGAGGDQAAEKPKMRAKATAKKKAATSLKALLRAKKEPADGARGALAGAGGPPAGASDGDVVVLDDSDDDDSPGPPVGDAASAGGAPGAPPVARDGAQRRWLVDAEVARAAEAMRCLGLAGLRGPTSKELRQAYRRAALRWHPDRNQGREEVAKARFQQVRAAFELLQAALAAEAAGAPAAGGRAARPRRPKVVRRLNYSAEQVAAAPPWGKKAMEAADSAAGRVASVRQLLEDASSLAPPDVRRVLDLVNTSYRGTVADRMKARALLDRCILQHVFRKAGSGGAAGAAGSSTAGASSSSACGSAGASGSRAAFRPKAFLRAKKEPADGSRAAISPMKAFLKAKPADGAGGDQAAEKPKMRAKATAKKKAASSVVAVKGEPASPKGVSQDPEATPGQQPGSAAAAAEGGAVAEPQAQAADRGKSWGGKTILSEKKSGVPGVFWEGRDKCWKVKWNTSQGSERKGRSKIFTVALFQQFGQSTQAAEAAALQAAIAFREELLRSGQMKAPRTSARQSGVAGVVWSTSRRRWFWRARGVQRNGTDEEKYDEMGTVTPKDDTPEEVERARLLAVERLQEFKREKGCIVEVRVTPAWSGNQCGTLQRQSGVKSIQWYMGGSEGPGEQGAKAEKGAKRKLDSSQPIPVEMPQRPTKRVRGKQPVDDGRPAQPAAEAAAEPPVEAAGEGVEPAEPGGEDVEIVKVKLAGVHQELAEGAGEAAEPPVEASAEGGPVACGMVVDGVEPAEPGGEDVENIKVKLAGVHQELAEEAAARAISFGGA